MAEVGTRRTGVGCWRSCLDWWLNTGLQECAVRVMDPEERRLQVHEMRVEILLQVGSSFGWHNTAQRSTHPMLYNTVALRADLEGEGLDVGLLLFNDSEETELERSWEAGCRR